MDEALDGKLPFYTSLKVCDTPQILLDIGCEQLPMLYTQKHLKNAILPTDDKNHRHGLEIEQIKRLPELLSYPAMIIDSPNRKDSIIVVTSEVDKSDNPIIAIIKPNGNGKYEVENVSTNFITSVYGRNNFPEYFKRIVQSDNLLFCDKQKSQAMFERWGEQYSELTNNLDYNIIIHKSRNIVKGMQQENIEYKGNSVTQQEDALESSVKAWYLSAYPDDGLGTSILDKVTFSDVQKNADNIYDVLGVGDSVIRERVEEKLLELTDKAPILSGENKTTSERTVDDIRIGDRYLLSDMFGNKEVTVTSLTGIYPYEVGITEITNSNGHAFNITQNIDKFKLHSKGKYLGNDEPEKTISVENKNQKYEQLTLFGEAEPEIKAEENSQNFTITDDNFGEGGAKTKFRNNVEAIKTLKKIENENRLATLDEQIILSKYSGWGGIPQAFDKSNSSWSNEYSLLKNLLSEKEYQAASRSTLSSFYTPSEVIDGVYQALQQFGFKGGNVLEPSMGIGKFFGKMPYDMRKKSHLYGVEIDSLSGRISKFLYPNANIQIKGFEQTNFNNNSFDVVVGNIPFGDFKISDKAFNKYGFKIHDYFIAKSVEQVKPGGIVAIVTSKYTMDKQNNKARRYIAEQCDLLGAVRLPAGTFKDANNVTTDILFFQKRKTRTVEIPDWVTISKTSDGIPCNKYFVDNPHMILGQMVWDERMKGIYGENSKVTTCIADESIQLSEQIRNAIIKIKGSIQTVKFENDNDKENFEIIPADPTVRNFTYTLVDGSLYFRENEVMIKTNEAGKTLERMKGLHEIRLATMEIIDAQVDNCSDSELERLQKKLNFVYDKFVKKYGYITNSDNAKCFKADDDYNTLAALEIIDVENKTVNKAEIFSKRTIKSEQKIITVDNADEALQVSLDRLGKVDIRYMAGLVKVSCDEIIKDLTEKGNIFRNPIKAVENDKYSGYEELSEYLSGNVRRKLQIAESYAASDDSYKKNVKALKTVIPKDLEASEISVRIGANWIDLEDYNSFLTEYAHADMYNHPVERTRMGEYKIEGKFQDKSISAVETYGTVRMNSYQIFENLLNQRNIVVRDRHEDYDGKVTYEINTKETQLAKEKARKMSEGFVNWLWKDINRRDKYVHKYNEMFNAIKCREYDGSHQSFPGMNPYIKLRPHQENAVLRGKLGGNTLLAHCVGAGKSFEMIAITMEKRRLGLINKACVVVPKHLTLQTASEWLRLYPKSRLLVATPEDFSKDKRQKFIARCVTGEYDAVIMSYEQFGKLPMSDEYRKQFIEKEHSDIVNAIQKTDKNDRVSVKALERQKVKLEEKIKQLLDSSKDNSLCFEKLGFDYLVVDEAHNYKNCFVSTKMSNVAGIQTTASKKSEDMYMKTEYLNNKYGCNNIVFCTGTPIAAP